MADEGKNGHANDFATGANSGILSAIATAFLFDLDGTLIDSEAAHKAAEVVTLRTFGLETNVAELFRYTGVPYRTMLAALEQQSGIPLPIDEFFERHKPNLLAKIGTEITLFPDVDDCLVRLHGQPLAIATSSPGWYVSAVLESFPELAVFQHIVCADDVTNGKPDPEAFQTAAAALRTDAAGCIAIEDSANGVASAKAAGCYTIGIQRDERIDLSQADELIATLAQVNGLPRGTSG